MNKQKAQVSGRKGGLALLKKYGRKHFRKLALLAIKAKAKKVRAKKRKSKKTRGKRSTTNRSR